MFRTDSKNMTSVNLLNVDAFKVRPKGLVSKTYCVEARMASGNYVLYTGGMDDCQQMALLFVKKVGEHYDKT